MIEEEEFVINSSHKLWMFSALVICVIFILAQQCLPVNGVSQPVGDAARGAILFAQGDGEGPGCQSCHCPDASGGCRLSPPNIQGATYDVIDARTRDTSTQHPGGKFDFTDQDVADRLMQIEAILRDVEQRIPDLEGLSVVTKDGLPIASALNTRVDEDRISAMTAAMLSLAERVVDELERGRMDEMIIKGTEGLIIIRDAGFPCFLQVAH